MEVNTCLQNKNLKVVNVNIDDLKLKLRLYEIGLYPNAKIKAYIASDIIEFIERNPNK